MGTNQKLKYRLKKAARIVKSAPKLITDPQSVVESLQKEVMVRAEELVAISQTAGAKTKLGMIRAIQKKFPDAKPKCPNCGFHSDGYDGPNGIIDHMRSAHRANI